MSEDKKLDKKPDWSDPTDDDIVEHLIIKKGVPVGTDGEVSVVEDYIESKRYNRQEFINSFRDDVGILNILKKVNAGLINPATLACSFDTNKPIDDYSKIPTDIGDALDLVDKAHKLYAQLPNDLKQGLDFNTFCKTFDQAKFDAYIKTKEATEVKTNE